MSKQFKVGDVVRVARRSNRGELYWAHQMDKYVGTAGVVEEVTESGNYVIAGFGDWVFAGACLEPVKPASKVRILERGKLLDTEFDSPVEAGDWLRDNGVTGEFELIRVESLGKVKASITVEAV